MFLFAEAVLKNPHTKGSDENALEKEAKNGMRNWRDQCVRRKKTGSVQSLTDR